MPINYLALQPQVTEYCQTAREGIIQRPEKVEAAIALLRRLADELQSGSHNDLPARLPNSSIHRAALPAHETISASFSSDCKETYHLLASDGSQITSSHHDVLPIALVNTATVYLQPGSGQAPQIKTQTEFIRNKDGTIATDFIREQLVNAIRDVREMQVLAHFPYSGDQPLIVLGDGPLELFQEPRSGEEHQTLFNEYLQTLQSLNQQGRITAGYTDKPRADLVLKMLECAYQAESTPDISGITDADIFTRLLAPGERSAIFCLHSPSSSSYQDAIRLHFFYLNVGTKSQPWIVRVEITAAAAAQPEAIALLQSALLAQCALMSARPYPYILHRAHEEAVVHFDEKERVLDLLSHTLREMGLQPAFKSNKLDAKELGKRTRLK